ncbi:MAG TPA: diaminopimelate decarboxylase [Phycisphaerae bacterium]|nr:diaminopimelate decarboxylase [Phycisphaerae bacterium]
MDHFQYQSGELFCEGVPISQISDAIGTPVYIYSAATLLRHYDAVAAAFAAVDPLICYSIKSCGNFHICRLLRERGAGFDVVSGGEVVRALAAGGEPAKIVFAGVGKTDEEIERAIDANIGWFNIESEAELENLIAIARRRGISVSAALRVNPDVDPKTHRYTSTGKKETKFGVDLDRARRVFDHYGRQDSVRLRGIHLHIGSPVNTVEPYVAAIQKGLALIDELRTCGFLIDMLDIGGGFGAHYKGSEAPPAVRYAEAIVPLLAPYAGQGATKPRLQIIMEPGRSIAANAGILVTRVLYLKKSGERDFLIIDAGMNDLIRPALYEAYHFIWPVRPATGFVTNERGECVNLPGLTPMDVVGPVCESGDFFAHERMLPPMQRGDLVAIFTAGAYGMVMASHYNSRPNPPEVLVEGDGYRVIRRRETYEDLLLPEQT